MWRGCPNHASYTARTSGEVPIALYFSGITWLAPGVEHPWGKREINRRAVHARCSIDIQLEACEDRAGCRIPSINPRRNPCGTGPRSSHAGQICIGILVAEELIST